MPKHDNDDLLVRADEREALGDQAGAQVLRDAYAFWEGARRAQKEVASWPEWKRAACS